MRMMDSESTTAGFLVRQRVSVHLLMFDSLNLQCYVVKARSGGSNISISKSLSLIERIYMLDLAFFVADFVSVH